MLKNNITTIITSVLLLCTAGVYASTPVPPSDYTGSRSSTNGMTGTTPWSSNPGIKVTWNITTSGPTFHYLYNLTVPSKDFSHAIFELSDNITPENIDSLIFNMKVNGVSRSVPDPTLFVPGGMGNSNPGLPADIYGIKIELTGTAVSIAFDSLRAPMWGDFYAKDGKSGNHFVYAYNTGFGTDPGLGTTNFTPWIAVPDTKVRVPEPTTYLLLLTALGFGLALSRRKVAEAS